MKKIKVLIIGDGVTAYYFLWVLSHSIKTIQLDVTWISSNRVFPRVDPNIWPLITLNGIQEGINALGDNLFSSFKKFEEVQTQFPFAKKVNQYCIVDEQDQKSFGKFIRRHGKSYDLELNNNVFKGTSLNSYFVKPLEFFKSVESSVKKNSSISIKTINKLVVGLEEIKDCYRVKFSCGEFIDTNNLFVFSGIGSKFLSTNFLHSSKTHRHQVSKGLVYQVKIKLNAEGPFVLTSDKDNIIYDGRGIIQTSLSPDSTNSFLYSSFRTIYGDLFDGKEFQPYFGLRDKGKKRLPLVSVENEPERFMASISGLYKNAWTIGLREVIDMVNIWLKRV